MSSAFAVAKQIRERLPGTSGHKLQKLIYYCQVWSLVWRDEPLFADPIEAWRDGPVVPNVREDMLYRNSGQVERSLPMAERDVAHIDRVLVMYGHMSMQQLIDLTHDERPWQKARAGLAPDAKSNEPMPLETIAQFYKSLWADAQQTNDALNEKPEFQGTAAELFEKYSL